MILDYFFGTPDILPDNNEFKQAIPKTLGGFYGWSPYFYYIINEGKLNWNNSILKDLKVEMFSIDNKNIPMVNDNEVQIQIEESELLEINSKILKKLEIGPLIFWVPIAAAFNLYGKFKNWNNIIKSADEYRLFIPWNITHCVVVFGYKNNSYLIHDCSIRVGNLKVPKKNLILNLLAMNLHPSLQKLREIEDNKFHLLISK
jgi:hypothetical protein